MIRYFLILLYIAIGLDAVSAASPSQVLRAQTTVRCEAIDAFGFAKDGSRLAYTQSLMRSVTVVRCETGHPVAELSGLGENLAFHCVVFSNDGERLAICANKRVAVYQLPSFTKQKTVTLAGDVYAVALPRNLDFIAVGRRHGITVRELLRKHDGHVFRPNANRILSVAVSHDGGNLAITALPWGGAQMWETTSGRELQLEGTARMIDAADKQGKRTKRFVASDAHTTYFQVVFSPDGSMLAAVGKKSIKHASGWVLRAVAKVWEAGTGKQVWEHESEDAEFYSAVAFHPSEDLLLLGGLVSVRPLPGRPKKQCGQDYRVEWEFPLDNRLASMCPRPRFRNIVGYVVQRVVVRCKLNDCDDCPTHIGSQPGVEAFTYWEAWPVKLGDDKAYPPKDIAQIPVPNDRCGFYFQQGSVSFYCWDKTGDLGEPKIPSRVPRWQLDQKHGDSCPTGTGGQPSTTHPPEFELHHDPDERGGWRYAYAFFNCCPCQNNFVDAAGRPDEV